jgi:hypothetical protein
LVLVIELLHALRRRSLRAKILDLNWPQIVHVVLEAKDGPDKYLCFHPNLLGRLSREGEREASGKLAAPYSVTIAIVSDLAELISKPRPTRCALPSISSGLDTE